MLTPRSSDATSAALVTTLALMGLGCEAFVSTSDFTFDRGEGGGGGAATSTGALPSTGSLGSGAGPCDDFDRPDSDALGDAWTEKDPSAFAIQGGELVHSASGPAGYKNNLAFRADFAEEHMAASVVFSVDALPTGGPRLFVRAPAFYAEQPDTLFAYILQVTPEGDAAGLSRIDNNTISTGGVTIDPPVEPGVRYRLRMRVEYTQITMGVDREESPGVWEELDTGTWSDSNTGSLDDAGTAGVAADATASVRFDDFCVAAVQ